MNRQISMRGLGAMLIAMLLVLPGELRAAEYDTFIDVHSEEDLLDLLAVQEIDDATYQVLQELMSEGVDLNNADRDELYALPNLSYADVDGILAYRDEVGTIWNPGDLVVAGVLDERKLLAIVPFVRARQPLHDRFDTSGRVKFETNWVLGDFRLPTMALSGRVSTLKHLDLGVAAVLTRNRVGPPIWDPNRSGLAPDDTGRAALAAEGEAVRVHLPKFYAQWETKNLHLVGGTYRIGFGESLTFDNSGRARPDGIHVDDAVDLSQEPTRACKQSTGELTESPCAGDEADRRVGPDYRWSERLRGAALGVRDIALPKGALSFYGFASLQTRGLYQYELVDRAACADPRNDDDPACSAPNVYLLRDDPLEPTSRISFQTLPQLYNELTAGGHVEYALTRRTRFGVTGYGARPFWLVEGADLDFQEWSTTPFGGPYGAVGLDVSLGLRDVDVLVEAARSFDAMTDGGGGYAGIARVVWSRRKHEVEGSARYYGTAYANPFARPTAAADEFEGNRARDEAGGQIRYQGDLGPLELRSSLDLWGSLSEGIPKMQLKVRGDVDLSKRFRLGIWTEYSDKDLRDNDRDNCFSVSNELLEGEPVPCAGMRIRIGARTGFEPTNRINVSLAYQHSLMDERRNVDGVEIYGTGFRQDITAWLQAILRPTPKLTLRTRIRYLNEAVTQPDFMEQSLRAYLEAGIRPGADLQLKLRYELIGYLDSRDSSSERKPNPAHWLRFVGEVRF